MGKPILIILLVTTVIGILVSAKTLLMPTLHYPYLTLIAPGDIRVHILQRGQPQASQCRRSLTNQATAVTGACSICRIEKSSCETDLGSTMRDWLDDGPLSMPSARMAYGVIVFEALQQEVALAACQASEKQSVANTHAANITCFPAGTKRPLLRIEADILDREYVDKQHSFLVVVAIAVGLLALAVALLASLRRLAVREPTEDASRTIRYSQPVALKLSNILKRVADILLAVVLLLLLFPIFLIVAFLIRIHEGAPVFYMSNRFISADTSVIIFKFRTMVRDAASPKYQLAKRFMRDGYLDIPLNCEVYTPIGRFLERTQLVETLQLLNILFDGMSFVGNRPLPKENIELLKKFEGWEERFDSPAGITGISQIVGKYDLLPQQRLYLERMYASIYRDPNGNIFLCDLYIIGYTVFLLFTGRYLNYDRALALLIRCGAKKWLAESQSCLPGTIKAER